jgi:hypothetical protein
VGRMDFEEEMPKNLYGVKNEDDLDSHVLGMSRVCPDIGGKSKS